MPFLADKTYIILTTISKHHTSDSTYVKHIIIFLPLKFYASFTGLTLT
jgi:hypothetical protein